MTKKIFVAAVLLFSFLISSPVFATAQIGERLIYDGKERMMFSCPDIPEDDPRIRKLSGKVRKLPDDDVESEDVYRSIIFSTACWRQYLGTWEIKDDRLYLTKIIGRYELVGKDPIFAEWFSGELRVPTGERLKYVHMGFRSIYEQDIIMQIKDGVVIKTEIIDNREKAKENVR